MLPLKRYQFKTPSMNFDMLSWRSYSFIPVQPIAEHRQHSNIKKQKKLHDTIMWKWFITKYTPFSLRFVYLHSFVSTSTSFLTITPHHLLFPFPVPNSHLKFTACEKKDCCHNNLVKLTVSLLIVCRINTSSKTWIPLTYTASFHMA